MIPAGGLHFTAWLGAVTHRRAYTHTYMHTYIRRAKHNLGQSPLTTLKPTCAHPQQTLKVMHCCIYVCTYTACQTSNSYICSDIQIQPSLTALQMYTLSPTTHIQPFIKARMYVWTTVYTPSTISHGHIVTCNMHLQPSLVHAIILRYSNPL